MTDNLATAARPKYVIVSDCDAPEPKMVCQWVSGVGYCYLDRSGTKPDHDGMCGDEASSVNAFGFVWDENADGTVSFHRADRPVTATYRDGVPRRWQGRSGRFEHRRLLAGAIKVREPEHDR